MDETLLDQWIRRLKDNPTIAIILFLGISIGALASFTGSLKSIAELFGPSSATVAPEIRAFQSRPGEIRAGDAAVIEWNVRGADSVQLDNEIGVVPLSGSRQVSPTKTTTYTLTATNRGVTSTSTATLEVATHAAFEGALVLNDVFAGDAGWKQPQDSVFMGSVGGGRFRMEWIENRSAQCVTRPVAIGIDEDFSLQVTMQAMQETGYGLGICWDISGVQANYKLYLMPGTSSLGHYQLVRDEIWQQTGPDGLNHPYGHSVNLLDLTDVNHRFSTTAIKTGTGTNVLTVRRQGNKIRIFINNTYVNEATYAHAAVDAVGMFIAGKLAAEFSDFSVRVAR